LIASDWRSASTRSRSAAAMHAVVVRVDDVAVRDDDRAHGERREERGRVVDLLGFDAARREKRHVAAASEWQRGAHAARRAEISEPSGEAVLERRAAGVRRGDRRRGSGGKNRGQRALAASRELAAGAAASEIVVAKAVDDEQHDIAHALIDGEIGERRVARSAAARCGDRCDQIDEAAACVVGSHGTDFR